MSFFNSAKSHYERMSFPDKKDTHWRFSDLKFWSGDYVKTLLDSIDYRNFKCDTEKRKKFEKELFYCAEKLFYGKKYDAFLAQYLESVNIVEVSDDMDYNFIELSHPINIFIVAEGKSLNVINRKIFGDKKLFLEANFFFLKDGAHVDLTTCFSSDRDSHRYTRNDFILGDYCNLKNVFVEFGGGQTRSECNVLIEGEESEAKVYALTFGIGENTNDFRSSQIHESRNSKSDFLIKNILRERSKLAFQGKVRVEPMALKSEAYQKCDSLLLSKNARSDASPILEILTDDVQCSHGCTVSKPDEEELFYMESRGIGEKESQELLISGFAEAILSKITKKEVALEGIVI